MSLHALQTRLVLEMIRTGRSGDVRLIHSWFSYYLPPEDRDNIRLNPELDGGSFWDGGVYPNSLAITLAGERAPRQVWGCRTSGRVA
jgi:predicted dehydrogenase